MKTFRTFQVKSAKTCDNNADRVWCNIRVEKLRAAVEMKSKYSFFISVADDTFVYDCEAEKLESIFIEKQVAIKITKDGNQAWSFYIEYSTGKVFRSVSVYDTESVMTLNFSELETSIFMNTSNDERRQIKRSKQQPTRINGADLLREQAERLGIDLSILVARTALWAPYEAHQLCGGKAKNPNVRRKKPNDIETEGVRLDSNNYPNAQMKAAMKQYFNIVPEGYETCHVWDRSCYDVRCHTCFANLVLLPRAVAALSDYDEHIKAVLRYRAYELFNWKPEGKDVPEKPANYPSDWFDPSIE